MALDLDAALHTAFTLGASDLHLKVPSPPRARLDGELVELAGFGPVTVQDAERVRDAIVTAEAKRRQLAERGAADLSHFTADGRFRVAAFLQRNTPAFVFRLIPHAPDPAALGLPPVLGTWADAPRGLVAVTGPTGAGKSSTCAALLDLVNRRRRAHIVTIEDPIEFLHADKRSLISQREVGSDSPSHAEALRTAMRQDPDVILVGEVRDEETGMTALRAAETGHLVLCTLHTVNAAESLQRFIDLFGEGRAALARQMLAGTLIGITSQRLIPGAGGGRILNAEVLVNSSRVRDLVAAGADQHEVAKAVAAGEYYGMQTFDQDLLRHVQAGRIERETAIAFASQAHDFKLLLVQAGVDEVGTTRRAAALLPEPDQAP